MSDHVNEIISELTASGWELDGETRTEIVRLPTGKGPIFNGMANTHITTFGGRARLRNGNRFVTVGKRTTFFWVRGPSGEITNPQRVNSNLEEVAKAAGRI